MATAADKTKKNAVPQEKSGKSGSPVLVTALVALIAAAAAGSGVWFFAGKHELAKEKTPPRTTPAPAQYFGLEPAFVVNLNGAYDGPRYLQVEVQLMTRDPQARQQMQTHAPAIRARLLMLFSQVEPQQIGDRAGKEKLQAAALDEVQKLLKAETGEPCAEELLFTSFVTQ